MKIYHLYSQIKEITKYVSDSLNNYDLVLINDASDLFDIEEENSLLILHVESYDENIIDLVAYILKDFKDLKILALTNSVDFLDGTRLLQIGVKGYGNVYMHSVLLEQAVEVIMSNNVWIYPELAQHLIKNLVKNSISDTNKDYKLNLLTKHEKKCAMLASNGSSNKEIAILLDLQEITIKKHLSSVYKKFSIKNRIELVLYLR